MYFITEPYQHYTKSDISFYPTARTRLHKHASMVPGLLTLSAASQTFDKLFKSLTKIVTG